MTEEWFTTPLATRRKLAGDPHRPVYHFLPPRNWMNDPNGLFYWQGRYHLFYQFNPYRPVWGAIHWGHASSPDMVHWKDHPIALRPTEGSGDANGCWSGCVVEDRGVPTAIYTGFVDSVHTPVMLARAQDQALLTWEKSPHNPILQEPPEGVTQTDFRDPYVWREGERWKMVLGVGLKNGGGGVFLYQSDDLIHWHTLGMLFSARTLDNVQMWECPNFFPLGDRYVLLISLFPGILGVYYYVGKYDGRTFAPETEGFLSRSPFFYAPQVRRLKEDRMILFGWLLEGRDDRSLEEAGWAGVQSLPRELRLDEAGRLVSQPVREVQSLRGDLYEEHGLVLRAGETHLLPIAGWHLEIELLLEKVDVEMNLELLAAPDGTEKTILSFNPLKCRLALDLRESSHSEGVQKPLLEAKTPHSSTNTMILRIFVDGSVIEAWVGDQVALTGRVYPKDEMANRLRLSSQGGLAVVRSLKIWKMKAIWPLPDEV